jgi:hypothetical protein
MPLNPSSAPIGPRKKRVTSKPLLMLIKALGKKLHNLIGADKQAHLKSQE